MLLLIIALLALSLCAVNSVGQAADPLVRAYVVNAFSANVSVIDADTHTAVATVPVVEYIFDVVITPDATLAYVSGALGADSLFIVQTSDNTLIGEVPGVSTPFGLDVTPDGAYIYAASRDTDEVTIVRVSDNTVVDTVAVGEEPMDVAVTPDGAFVYVVGGPERDPGWVMAIRTSDNTVVATVPVGVSPLNVAITPDSAFAYVTNYGFSPGGILGDVSVIRTSDNSVVDTITVGEGPRGIDITPDGAFAYVANRLTQDVSVIRTSDHTVTDTVSTAPAEPRWVAITPAGDFAYVALHTTAEVATIRLADNVLTERVPVGEGPVGIDFAEIPVEELPVSVDIKPGSWPNPLQLESKGVLPVAVCGTEDFDVTMIDPESVELTLEGLGIGVHPLRWSYGDVATPYMGEPFGGHDLGSDGYLDLMLKFKTQEVITTLGLDAFGDGDVVILMLTGNLKAEFDGTAIHGKDYVWILHK